MRSPQPPMRIAVVTQDFSGGGAERMMLNVAQGLATRGHHVEVVAIRPEGPYLDRVSQALPLKIVGKGRVSRSIPALARYLRYERPDSVLSTLVHMNVAVVLAGLLARSPTRVVLREAIAIGKSAEDGPPLPIQMAYRLQPWAYRRADHVIAISEGLADEVRSVTGLPYPQVTAVHNPVLSERDLASAREIAAAPHAWLEDLEVPVVLSVGRLVVPKDHRTLLHALAQVRQERAVRLVILGTGPLREELLAEADRLGIGQDVLLPGFVENPFVWMKRASVLAHTARWEGFGNVLVEALACGIPVVATDCPSGPAEILDGGRFGRLVPVGHAEAVARAILETLKDPPDPLFLRRRAQEFTVEAIVPRYEAILAGDVLR